MKDTEKEKRKEKAKDLYEQYYGGQRKKNAQQER